MPDIYLYDDAPILRNKLQIKEKYTPEPHYQREE